MNIKIDINIKYDINIKIKKYEKKVEINIVIFLRWFINFIFHDFFNRF